VGYGERNNKGMESVVAFSLSLEGEGWGVGEIKRDSLSLDGRGSGCG